MPMGSLVAALLVALWLPSGPLMAAALISGEAAALQAGMGSAGVPRAGQKQTSKASDLRTLRRLSAALIIAVRSSQVDEAGSLVVLRGASAADELPLDRQGMFIQRWSERWTNAAVDESGGLGLFGLAGGSRAARDAGLIALPPPMCG